MKMIKISLDSIKSSCGNVSANTGEFGKVLPYYLRKLEDIAVQFFQKKLDNTDANHNASLEKGGECE